MSTANCARSVPRARIAAASLGVMTASVREMSHPTNSNFIPDCKTMSTDSGSTHILNSATCVTLPIWSATAPITTQRLISVAMVGSLRSASAMLVSGPSVTSSSSRACRCAAEIISSMASPGVGTLPNSGKPMSPMPSTPCTNCAVSSVRTSGWAAPT